MDDEEVIETFVAGSAVQGFGSRLHIERDCLLFDGWWHAAFRVTHTTFALRDEAPPEETPCLLDLAMNLQAHGLYEVAADPSLLVAVTYTAIDLGAAEWTLWSTDLATAETDLATRVGRDAFFGDPPGEGTRPSDWAAGQGGLRRAAGLAPLIILAVGVETRALENLAAGLENCHIEARTFDEIHPEACQSSSPNLALVNATSEQGRQFIRQFEAANRERLLPIVALSLEGTAPGADVTLDPASNPAEWAEHIRNLLP